MDEQQLHVASGTIICISSDSIVQMTVLPFDGENVMVFELTQSSSLTLPTSSSISRSSMFARVKDEIVILYEKNGDINKIIEYTLTPPRQKECVKHLLGPQASKFVNFEKINDMIIPNLCDLCETFQVGQNRESHERGHTDNASRYEHDPFKKETPTNAKIEMLISWKWNYVIRTLKMYGVKDDAISLSMLKYKSIIDGIRYNPWMILSIDDDMACHIALSRGIDFISQQDGLRMRRFLEYLKKNFGILLNFDEDDKDIPFDLVKKYAKEFDLTVNLHKRRVKLNKFETHETPTRIEWNGLHSRMQIKLQEILEEKRDRSISVEDLDLADTLHENQVSAIKNALEYQNSVISGGAGCGKTLTISEIIRILSQKEKKGLLCSFTGKAVTRMREMVYKVIPKKEVNAEFSTIHKVIISPYKYISSFDYVIVDEFSMVSEEMIINLFNLEFVRWSKKIFVGDSNQLKPINGENIMYYIKKYGGKYGYKLPITTLTKNYRSNHCINLATKAILEGCKVKFSEKVVHLPNASYNDVISLASDHDDVQIITPFVKEEKYIIDLIKRTKTIDEFGFFRGEKVRVIQNVYRERKLVLATGESGIYIGAFNGEGPKVIVEGSGYKDLFIRNEKNAKKCVFSSSEVMTIHKVQGSEYDNVILWNPRSSSFVSKEMIYTAMTRAKDKIYICGCMPIFDQQPLDSEDFEYMEVDRVSYDDL